MAVQVLGPAAAAMGEVLTMGDQPLVQVAGEQWDAVGARVMSEEVAGHADLAAAAGAAHVMIEPGPVLDRINAGGLKTGEGDRLHGDSCRRTPVLAGKVHWHHGLAGCGHGPRQRGWEWDRQAQAGGCCPAGCNAPSPRPPPAVLT